MASTTKGTNAAPASSTIFLYFFSLAAGLPQLGGFSLALAAIAPRADVDDAEVADGEIRAHDGSEVAALAVGAPLNPGLHRAGTTRAPDILGDGLHGAIVAVRDGEGLDQPAIQGVLCCEAGVAVADAARWAIVDWKGAEAQTNCFTSYF